MSNTLSYMHAFTGGPPKTVGAVYLAKPPSYHHTTARFPAITPEVIAKHQSGERPVVHISSDFDEDVITQEDVTQLDLRVEVDLSEWEKCDTIPCGPPRPHVGAGEGYRYLGSKCTDIDLLLSFQWDNVTIRPTGEEEYVGEAYIFSILHYVWRREGTGEFIAQRIPHEEL